MLFILLYFLRAYFLVCPHFFVYLIFCSFVNLMELKLKKLLIKLCIYLWKVHIYKKGLTNSANLQRLEWSYNFFVTTPHVIETVMAATCFLQCADFAGLLA